MSSNARVQRATRALDKIAQKLGITEGGKQWLIAAIDPFHDEPLNCVGFPDGSTAPTITRVIKYTATINAPTGTTAGANWDCLVLDTPFPNAVRFNTAYQQCYNGATVPLNEWYSDSADTPGIFSMGGVTVFSGPTGTQWTPANMVLAYSASSGYAQKNLQVASALLGGDFRIIAKGFEVYNATAELYKGGTVTCFESPMLDYETAQTYQLATAASTVLVATTSASVAVNPFWPQSSSQAYSLVNSAQWNAEDGCYVVAKLNDVNIPIENGSNFTAPLFYSTLAQGDKNSIGPNLQSDANFSVAQTHVSQSNWSKFNFAGAFFTGLPNSSALTVDYLVVIETMPAFSDTNLYPLAKPPPCHDVAALELYSYIVDKMPVGVPVAMNGFGDWFTDAIATVADHVSPVLSAIPLPGFQLAGAVGNMLKHKPSPPMTYPTNISTQYLDPNRPRPKLEASQKKNAAIRAKNELTRAKNKEILAKRAMKAAKK
jgi:hypothetical protein